jgi:hypothetical protein
MIDNSIIRKIEEFVFAKPRSVQEIAKYIGKNWRTADRYVEEIISEYGTLDKRVFREGTRGSLKIVYWAAVEKVRSSIFQEELEKKILEGNDKTDFSAFDIFQHVDDRHKRAIIEFGIDENTTNLSELKEILLDAKKQVIMFSGNLSFVNLSKGKFDMMDILEELVQRGVSIKIIGKVDLTGRENIEKVLGLNFKAGKPLVEVRHRNQPLRAIIVDDKVLRIKEVKEPTGKAKELDKRLFVFYTIRDKEWIGWITRIFWKMFQKSIGSQKRLEEISKLRI